MQRWSTHPSWLLSGLDAWWRSVVVDETRFTNNKMIISLLFSRVSINDEWIGCDQHIETRRNDCEIFVIIIIVLMKTGVNCVSWEIWALSLAICFYFVSSSLTVSLIHSSSLLPNSSSLLARVFCLYIHLVGGAW